ncbi:antitoxin of toxin-antitoxin stability system [Rhizobium metallidurans]|uniref:Antitoxin (DNA-binding transcriptional repressor) of toxin-antitoxin stability system n=1 Tax=Rhizobium metallidurans TaxID=1265931 RepID=A0A7W6CVD9_9HYPH|nr:antitoxin (DNA-binding transcriptional repressor) of toxin-antitoxin stability system [Rhizobium metallidurans]
MYTFPAQTEPRHASVSPVDIITSFLKQVEDGQRFVLTSHHKVVAEIGPPSKDIVARKPGALRGKIKGADDFDSLPADALSSMEDEA